MNQLRFLIIPALSAVIFATASAADGRSQATSPPEVTPAPPAKLDSAALDKDKKVDELLAVHMKGMNFTGTVLLAAAGKPLLVKGYGDANIEWQIPKRGADQVPDRIDHETAGETDRVTGVRQRWNPD
jgi:hypothetical protein